MEKGEPLKKKEIKEFLFVKEKDLEKDLKQEYSERGRKRAIAVILYLFGVPTIMFSVALPVGNKSLREADMWQKKK